MYRIGLLTTSAMTPAERAAGRFMRAPDGHGDGGDDSNPDVNNSNVNSGGDNNNPQNQNNDGPDPDLASFWEDESDDNDDDNDDPQSASRALGQEIGGIIEKYSPPPVFTKEIADGIANGDLDGVNAAMQKAHQESLKQTVAITAKLLGGVMDRMTRDFDQKIQEAFGQRDNSAFLESQFPVAKDPAMRPVVERVWNQALKNSKGDRAKATKLTRGMLEAFGAKVVPDSLRTPPDDPTHGINTAASKSLVESLLGRD